MRLNYGREASITFAAGEFRDYIARIANTEDQAIVVLIVEYGKVELHIKPILPKEVLKACEAICDGGAVGSLGQLPPKEGDWFYRRPPKYKYWPTKMVCFG